jgi:hypothetical protein
MVPGAMGYYDSMAVAAERWMIPAILIGLVTFTGVIAAAVLTETRNLRLWGSAV